MRRDIHGRYRLMCDKPCSPGFCLLFFLCFLYSTDVSLMLPSWTFCTRKLESACRCSYPAFPPSSYSDLTLCFASASRHFRLDHPPILANVDSVCFRILPLLHCYTRSPVSTCCLVHSCFHIVKHVIVEQSCFRRIPSDALSESEKWSFCGRGVGSGRYLACHSHMQINVPHDPDDTTSVRSTL